MMQARTKTEGAGLRLAAATLAALAWAAPAQALVVQVDTVELRKNGTRLFEDNFDNNLTPSQEPGVYSVFGAFPNGAESGGKLTMDSAWGGMTQNALGQPRQNLNVIGLTGQSPANPTSLGRGDLISFSGVFDIVDPVGPLNNGYGLVLREGVSGAITHSLTLQVGYLGSAGQSVLRFYDQDFVAGTLTVVGQIPFSVPVGADQIALEITNVGTQSTDFAAWYAFGSGGVLGAPQTFSAVDTMFTMGDYVHAAIQVYSAVPEPSAWALCGAALLGLGAQRRRAVVKRSA